MQMKIVYKFNNINSALYKLIKYANRNYIKDSKNKNSVMNPYFFINRAVIFWYNTN